jgi:hypothetical protein
MSRSRPVLRRRALIAVTASISAATLLFFMGRPLLSSAWSTAGSPALYLVGVVGSLLSLTPFFFSLAKRSGASADPPFWFVAHVLAATLGIALLFIHSGAQFGRPPALLLLAGLFLVVQGCWARLYLPHRIANRFGARHQAFLGTNPTDRNRIRAVIERKQALLKTLDPRRDEATFSPTLALWLKHPLLSARYGRLARHEKKLIGQTLPPVLAYWRAMHIGVAFLFLLGLIIHVITVTFFAGYVADGGPIHWWHLADWGGP